jgi:3-phenylpropionate/trans-cinnamate dioxygenase ferredoxin component
VTSPDTFAFPAHLAAPASDAAPWRQACDIGDLPPGTMRRATFGDLDVLVAHTPEGLIAVDDRCPHMAAPLSLGELEGCLVSCPLHRGRFDLETGDTVRFPTTGGLDADGRPHAPWTPPGSPPKPEPSDTKARARALTRVRRLRYYRVRVVDGTVEVAVPG